MSRNAFVASLKNMGGPFRTRGPASVGGSGSNAQSEEAGSTASSIEVDQGVEVAGIEVTAEALQVDSAPDKRRLKRQRTVGTKPPRNANVIRDGEEDEEEDTEVVPGSSSGPKKVGNYSVEQLAKMMSGIPSKPDWHEMSGSGLNVIFQKCTEHWGEVFLLLVILFFAACIHFDLNPFCRPGSTYLEPVM